MIFSRKVGDALKLDKLNIILNNIGIVQTAVITKILDLLLFKLSKHVMILQHYTFIRTSRTQSNRFPTSTTIYLPLAN